MLESPDGILVNSFICGRLGHEGVRQLSPNEFAHSRTLQLQSVVLPVLEYAERSASSLEAWRSDSSTSKFDIELLFKFLKHADFVRPGLLGFQIQR